MGMLALCQVFASLRKAGKADSGILQAINLSVNILMVELLEWQVYFKNAIYDNCKGQGR